MPTPARLFALAAAGAAAAIAADALLRPRYSFAGKNVLITGGSRGLGLALARRLADEGANLALVARTRSDLRTVRDELEDRGAPLVTYFPADLTNRAEAEAAVDASAESLGGLDALFNVAGSIQVGPLDAQTEEDFDAAIAIHVYAPLYTTLAARRHFRAREPGRGAARVVNIASIGGLVAVPHLLPYSTSKHALVGLTDGLRRELRRENILVTLVNPGLMRTGSPPNVDVKGDHELEYAMFKLSDSIPGLTVAADRAAARIVHAAREGRARLTFPINARLAALADELAPNASAALASAVNAALPRSGDTSIRKGFESESRLSRNPITRITDRAAHAHNEL